MPTKTTARDENHLTVVATDTNNRVMEERQGATLQRQEDETKSSERVIQPVLRALALSRASGVVTQSMMVWSRKVSMRRLYARAASSSPSGPVLLGRTSCFSRDCTVSPSSTHNANTIAYLSSSNPALPFRLLTPYLMLRP